MSARIIDGKTIGAQIRTKIKEDTDILRKGAGVQPWLSVILVGDNPASVTYVGMKAKACEEAGIYSEVHRLPDTCSLLEVLNLISQLNDNPKIHGILVQLPLPAHIDAFTVMNAISPNKDVDGLHPMNIATLFATGECDFIPCTPQGIIELLDRSDVVIEGKHAVVVGRSNIVGKPISMLLLKRNATVTICHSRSRPLSAYTKMGDILVAAIGKAKMITADMVKEGAVVIDVGTNKVDGKLVGDVDFEEVSKIASAITPVPGGVGPLTIAMLLNNTLLAAQKQAK